MSCADVLFRCQQIPLSTLVLRMPYSSTGMVIVACPEVQSPYLKFQTVETKVIKQSVLGFLATAVTLLSLYKHAR